MVEVKPFHFEIHKPYPLEGFGLKDPEKQAIIGAIILVCQNKNVKKKKNEWEKVYATEFADAVQGMDSFDFFSKQTWGKIEDMIQDGLLTTGMDEEERRYLEVTHKLLELFVPVIEKMHLKDRQRRDRYLRKLGLNPKEYPID